MAELSHNQRIWRDVSRILADASRKLRQLDQERENGTDTNMKQGAQHGHQNSRNICQSIDREAE